MALLRHTLDGLTATRAGRAKRRTAASILVSLRGLAGGWYIIREISGGVRSGEVKNESDEKGEDGRTLSF
jgi:hypothetical protein